MAFYFVCFKSTLGLKNYCNFHKKNIEEITQKGAYLLLCIHENLNYAAIQISTYILFLYNKNELYIAVLYGYYVWLGLLSFQRHVYL